MTRRSIWMYAAVVLLIGSFPVCGQGASSPATRIVIGSGIEPVQIDLTLIAAGADLPIMENYGEYLMEKTSNGDIVPGLASWKWSPDGKQIDFTLRKGVKFHSGDPLTVADVQFSYERALAKNPTTKPRLRLMERFEAIDDYHFKMYFTAPDITFVPGRAGRVLIVSKRYFDRVGEDVFGRQPVGTGPYKFVRYVPGEYLDVERFDDYWGKKPSIKEGRFVFVSEDTTRVAKLKAGEVDFINNVVYPAIKDLEKYPNLKVQKVPMEYPTASVIFQNMNPKTPWYNRKVRLAMAYAIDWKSIINSLLDGIPNHWAGLSPGDPGYDPELKSYVYDPKKAKELLAEAGYPNGFNMKLYWPSGGRIPMLGEISDAIASYFAAVGIKTNLVGQDMGAFYATRTASKKPDAEFVALFAAGAAGEPTPINNMRSYFTKGGGFSVYTNPELEKIITEGVSTIDDAKMEVLVKRAMKILHDEVAYIPIFSTMSIFAMKKNIDFVPVLRHNMDMLLLKNMTVK